MTIFSANFQSALDARVARAITEGVELSNVVYPQYFNGLTSDGAYEIAAAFSGLTTAVAKQEGADFTMDAPVQRYSYMLTHGEIGLAFKVTHVMKSDDKLRMVDKWAMGLGRAGVEKMCVDHANILNRAFNNTYTYGDGKELCATDHPLAGGTAQNELSTPADLSTSSLNEALYTMKRTVDHRGKIAPLTPIRMLVPPEQERLAFQLNGSELEPSTTDNQANFFRGKFQVIVDPYFTDPDAWFLQAALHGLVSYEREALNFGTYIEESSRSQVYWCLARYSVGAEEWRGIFGTPGA